MKIVKWFQSFSRYSTALARFKTSKWKPVVGLEVHSQITAESKLFSGAGTDFKAAPNTQVSFVDGSLPGTLPVINKRCVEAAVLTALALNCKIHKTSYFERKHYFYADLPAGYQITQQLSPLATDGHVKFCIFNPAVGRGPEMGQVRLKQIQIEQDSGKSLHDDNTSRSLIDLNRAGIGLMELVFEPDLKDGEEAAGLIKELILILQRLGSCSCLMEEGSLRIDANISVHKANTPLGIRTEVKNLNSIRQVVKAIDYEIERQIEVLENGGKIINETRSFDSHSKVTVPMRDKEAFQDYRFMPEPNLPPLLLCDNNDKINNPNVVNIDKLKENLPVLPEDDRQILLTKYKLPLRTALIILNIDGLQAFFEKIMEITTRDAKLVSNWLLISIQSQLLKADLSYLNSPVSPEYIGELLDLIQDGKINPVIADKVLTLMFDGEKRKPHMIVEEKNWFVLKDEIELERACQEAIQRKPKEAKRLKNGKDKSVGPILAEVYEITNYRAEPKLSRAIITRLVDKM